MKLKGVLDFSLGNFLCLRGFASMGVLQDISEPPKDIQRIPKDERLKEVGDFLRKGELVFFPEIILCACLHEETVTSDIAAGFFEKAPGSGMTIDLFRGRRRGQASFLAATSFGSETKASRNPTIFPIPTFSRRKSSMISKPPSNNSANLMDLGSELIALKRRSIQCWNGN